MKIKIYNSTAVGVRPTDPAISIGLNGVIRLNHALVDLLSATTESMAALIQDEENPSDWYITLDAPEGISLRQGEYGLLWNSQLICNAIFQSLDTELRSGTMRVGTVPCTVGDMKLWPILTSSLTNRRAQ